MRQCSEKSSEFTIEPEPVDSPAAQQALSNYLAELEQRFGRPFDASRSAPPAPGDFEPPAGVFLLVRAEQQVAGCGALRTAGDGIAEIRRMWISPALRGRGAGRALLGALEEQAELLDCGVVRLDTAAELHEAKALYASAGYVEIPAYNDNEYARHWFEKKLR